MKQNNLKRIERYVRAVFPPDDLLIDQTENDVLRLRQLIDVFRWYLMGLVFSLFIFVCELIADRLKRQFEKRNVFLPTC